MVRGECQKAYRVMAARSLEQLEHNEADLWDTGMVQSDTSLYIPYGGKCLKSGQRCYWKVCVLGRDGRVSPWSSPAFFEMGLLEEKDWKARWITSPYGGSEPSAIVPAPLFRKSFILEKEIVSARVYLCGLGYHELYLNGRKIGDEVLAPAFTRYDRTVLYNTYDITEAILPGENVIGVILGNGFYNSFTEDVWDNGHASWRHQPKLIAQVHLTYADGQQQVIASDSTWKVSKGPIVMDAVRNGEQYDARLEKAGWSCPGYRDEEWEQARFVRSPGGTLKSFQMTPIRVTETIRPVSLREAAPGVWVYDLGQNISGWVRLQVSAPGAAGNEITLKYAEKLKADGTIDQSNIDTFVNTGEFQTDKYITKGGEIETWEPRFTYHGFQYIQMTGFPGTPSLDSLCGRVVHTDFQSCGEFTCSNELLNRIQTCARWSTLGNYHGIPTDCPHREKNGWTGDALLSAEQVLMNFDPASAYTKWMKDFLDVQRPSGQVPGVVPTGFWGYNWGSGPAWDSAMILIPWYLYLYCGDLSILEVLYDGMKRYLEFMTSMSEDFLLNFGLGDWCPPVGGPDAHKCPTVVTDTAYYFVDADTVAKCAALLGKTEDAARYTELAASIREAFRRNFLDTETGIVTGHCQTSQACALYQGLVDEEEKARVLEKLVEQVEVQNRHIDCGILGAKYLLHTLTEMGRADLAYAIATQTSFPGWGHWMEQGATTLWETWNGDSSRNHHMFSDISAWFYKELAGINPDPEKPGFRHVILRPNPVPGLDKVECSHQSPYGRIECSWQVENNRFTARVEIPANSHATFYLPSPYTKNVMESGIPAAESQGIQVNQNATGIISLSLESGSYRISAQVST